MNLSLANLTRKVARVGAIGAVIFMVSGASFADQVYFRFGDGRVVYANRSYYNRYRGQGAVIVNTLPNGYVSDPYSYNNGAPVYYNQTYWHSHNRHWAHDPDGHYNGHHHHHHHH